jgi:parallel beta-helix repeat protein/predicted outer membrane repeat protein
VSLRERNQKMRAKTWKIQVVALCLWLVVGSACMGKVIYVDANAPGVNNGSSWTDAYNYLQDALADAQGSVKPVEVRIAQGIYKPDENTLYPDGSENQSALFKLINGVTIRGGYAGFGQPDPNKRDISAYCTILSGDIDDNDEPESGEVIGDNSRCIVNGSETDDTAVLDGVTIIGGYGGLGSFGGGMYIEQGSPTIAHCTFKSNRAEYSGGGICCEWNSNPTLTDCTFIGNSASGCGGGICTWERLTLTRCNFDGNSASRGGGIYNASSPILIDCRFSRNIASDFGGGIGSYDFGLATMVGCKFEKNWAPEGGGIGVIEGATELTDCIFIENSGYTGGGIWNDGSRLSLLGCTFAGNSADNGGAVFYGSDFTNCTFIDNSASVNGGAIIADPWRGLSLANCGFRGNSAGNLGGGIFQEYSRSCMGGLAVTNCTFVANSAKEGTTLVSFGSSCVSGNPSLVVANCIVADGGDQIWNDEYMNVTISYSDIRGGQASVYDPCNAVVWGEGNIDVDPCFVDPGYWDPNGTPEDANDDFWVDGDYHLKSQAGRWDANEGRWVIDDVTSPCIDAGDPMTPIGYEPFPNGGIINMGAYGGTAEASKSYFGEPPCETIVAGDINGDCRINFLDFRLMALHWMEEHD